MHLRFAREIRHTLVIVFVKRTHVGRNVKIKSSVRCLTRAFIAAVEKLILPLSTTNYRQRSSARKREYRLTHQLPARRTTSGDDPSVRSSTTQEHCTTYVGFSTVATRPTTACSHRPPATSTRKDYRICPPPKVPLSLQNIPRLLRDDRRLHVVSVRMTLSLLPLACP